MHLLEVNQENLIFLLSFWVLCTALIYLTNGKVLNMMRANPDFGYPQEVLQKRPKKDQVVGYLFYFLLAPLFFYFIFSYILRVPEPFFNQACSFLLGALILSSLQVLLLNIKGWANLTYLKKIKFTTMQDSYTVLCIDSLISVVFYAVLYLLSHALFFLGGIFGALVLFAKYYKLRKKSLAPKP